LVITPPGAIWDIVKGENDGESIARGRPWSP
jgi:hypothetical protein